MSRTETSARKDEGKLTDNGIGDLFGLCLEVDPIYLQVLFLAFNGPRYYLRLGDGKCLSPIVIMEKSVYGSDFGLGDVIVVKKRTWHADDRPEWHKALEDNDFWHIYITEYTVSDHYYKIGKVIGTYENGTNYRESVRRICHFLEDKNPNLNVNSLISLFSIKIEKLEKSCKAARDLGNICYNLQGYKAAVKDYAKAVKRDLYDSTCWSNCSQAFLRSRDYEDAELFALFALKFNPFHEKSYARLIQASLAQGNMLQARQYAHAARFMCRTHKSVKAFLKKAFTGPNDLSLEPAASIKAFPVKKLGQIYAFLNSPKKLTNEGVRKRLDTAVKNVEVANEEWEFVVMPLDSEDASELIQEEFRRLAKNECKRNLMKMMKKSEKLDEEKEKEYLLRQLVQIYAMKKERKKKEENAKRRNQQQKLRETARKRIQQEQESRKELEEKLKQKELKIMKEVKVGVKPIRMEKAKNSDTFQETLENGKRFFEEHHFRQAALAFEKSTEKHFSSKKGDLKEIQFASALCEVQAGRGYITDGMDILKVLVNDQEFAPAANYWLAVGLEKICVFKAAGKHAKSCIDALQEKSDFKGNMWPGTSETIVETTPAFLARGSMELIQRVTLSIPAPKAKCHLSNCCTVQGHAFAKQEIYLQDLEFKGYLNVTCEEDCIISFHPVCWKSLKEQGKQSKKSDKDFLGTECITPDCSGLIHSITIFDENNEVKLELLKDKKKNDIPVKEKKKKDKKKEKQPASRPELREKKKEKQGGTSKDAPKVEQKSDMNDTPKEDNATDTTQEKNKETESTIPKTPTLPIDPESLEWTKVTVLKPSVEEQQTDKPKSTKKKKKQKKKKVSPQADLLGDPLDASENVENEYVARLKQLKQEKEERMMSNKQLRKMKRARALQEEKNSKDGASDTLGEPISEFQEMQPIDPNNPFFIPEHLKQDNMKFEQFLMGKKSGVKASIPMSKNAVVPCYDGDTNMIIPSKLQEAGQRTKTDSISSSDTKEDPTEEPGGAACASLPDLSSSEEVDLNVTCSICLEPIDDFISETLDCEHTFHCKCIRHWLKQQSNCPNCRKFALMEEDYPTLLDAKKWLAL